MEKYTACKNRWVTYAERNSKIELKENARNQKHCNKSKYCL